MIRTVPIIFIALLLGVRAVCAAPLELISKPFQPTPSTFGDSADLELSADGKWAVFSSSGVGLTTNAVDDFILNVYLKNLQTGNTRLVSGISSTNRAGGNGHSYGAKISADGRYVVFETEADDLAENDTNEGTDVLLYDNTTETLSVLSGLSNQVAEGSSGLTALSANSRFVLIESDARGLSPLDTNDWTDLYLLDRDSGQVQLVSVNSNNTAAVSAQFPPTAPGTFEGTVSEDGRYVAFISSGTNHVPGVSSTAAPQVYLRDMQTGANVWVSRHTNGAASTFVSAPVLSRNGRYLLFLSANLEGTSTTSQDTSLYLYDVELSRRRAIRNPVGVPFAVSDFSLSGNGEWIALSSSNQVFLQNTATITTRLVSATPSGEPASGVSDSPQISDDGRYVVFTSTATNLAGGIEGELFQTYRYDANTGEVVLLSRGMTGGGANADTVFPVISGNGAVAGFMSIASNLSTNGNPRLNDVFAVAGNDPVLLVSSPAPTSISSTAEAGSSLEGQALSFDGQRIVFASFASDLVANDTNNARDIFLHDLRTGVTQLISVDTNGTPLNGAASFVGASRDARRIAFVAGTASEGTGQPRVFVYDSASGKSEIGSILPDGTVAGAIWEATLSQDGLYLAFRTSNLAQINIRDLHEGKTVTLTAPISPTLIGFSPGGRYLAARSGSAYSIIDWKSNAVVMGITSTQSLTNAFAADDSLHIALPRINTSTALMLFDFSRGTNGTILATNVLSAAISADGSTVVYQAQSVPLSADSNLFAYDVKTGTSSLLEIGGTNTPFRIRGPVLLSADGRFVTFVSTNSLTGSPGDQVFNDVFVYDRLLKTTTLVSENLQGTEGNFGSSSPSLSADGRLIAFESSASDLVENDRNHASDVFLRRLPSVDSDSDGLEDGWELLRFGNLNATAEADADNDGVKNSDEFRAGTDPNSAASRFELSPDLLSEGDTLVISAPAFPGKTYRLEYRAGLGVETWQETGQSSVATSSEVRFEVPLTLQGNGFFRVTVPE